MAIIYSRDKRTQILFRDSWARALISLGLNVKFVNRRDSTFFIFSLNALVHNIYREFRIVCGVSEGILLAIFRPQVLVVTGIGRLLYSSNNRRKYWFWFLKLFYARRLVITLNNTDFRLFK